MQESPLLFQCQVQGEKDMNDPEAEERALNVTINPVANTSISTAPGQRTDTTDMKPPLPVSLCPPYCRLIRTEDNLAQWYVRKIQCMRQYGHRFRLNQLYEFHTATERRG